MAFDGFIKLDGIDGESLDERNKGWIEIVAYDFGVSQSTSATASSNGGAGSGRASLRSTFGGAERAWLRDIRGSGWSHDRRENR